MRSVGILGLPGSGKTTLFEILTGGAGAPAGSHGRAHVGMVMVPDERLDRLAVHAEAKKTTHVHIQVVDSVAAGQSARAAARGPDLFSSVRDCEALVAVVRDFENPAVPIDGGVDPQRDLRSLETELILNDLVIVENRLERVEKDLRVGKKELAAEADLLRRCKEVLEAGRSLRYEALSEAEAKTIKGFQLLSRKPLLVVYNQDEQARHAPPAPDETMLAVALRSQLEQEVLALPEVERAAFRQELGIGEDGLTVILRSCYQLLGLISFFTVGPSETRAWTVPRGATAVDAAAEIHTDLAKGFIRAEVIGWSDLLESGGKANARSRGKLRLEGRDYVVQDGDCLEIRFNK